MPSRGFWSSSRRRIANERTRAAYGRAVGQFLAWCEARRLGLKAVRLAASRRRLYPDPPGIGPHGEAAPGRDPHALRLARRQPGPPGEPAAAAVRGPKHVVSQGRDASPDSPAEARKLLEQHRHGHAGRPPRPGALLGDALQLRAGERGPGDAEAGLLPAGEPGVAAGSTRRAGRGMTSRPTTGRAEALDKPTSRRPGWTRNRKATALPERGAGCGPPAEQAGRCQRRVVLAMIKRRAARPRGCRRRRAATRFEQLGSRRTSRTGGPSSTRSRSRGTRRRKRRSSTTGRRTR